MATRLVKFQKGFVGFLTFSFLKCFEEPQTLKLFEVLAWPLFALGYPLYASIRAIETNSKHQMRDLVAYWILFSSISLFELAFVKLIEWIPFWPFLKIIVISCLVLRRFTGAYYAYKWLVRLFLSVNQLQRIQVINWLNKRKELSLKRETFLAAAEQYLDENGTEALEKLIASKQHNSKAPNVAQNDINTVEPEENVAATYKSQSDIKVPNVAQNDINVVEHEENVTATDKISDSIAPNVAQNYINVVEHEENVVATDKISHSKAPNVAQNDISAVEHEENVATTDKISNVKAPNVAQNDISVVEHEENVADTDKIVKHVDTNLSQTQQKLGISRTQQKLGTSTEVKEVTSAATVRDYVLPVPLALRIQKEWTCAVCQVKTTSKVTLNSHLQGRKHKSKCEELKSSKQAMKVEGSSSTASNQEPKKAVSGNRLGQSKTQKAEEKLKVGVNEQWKQRKPVNVAAAGIKESKYWSGMCNVAWPGEIDMAAHMNGRRDKSLLKEFDGILPVPNYGAMVPQTLWY